MEQKKQHYMVSGELCERDLGGESEQGGIVKVNQCTCVMWKLLENRERAISSASIEGREWKKRKGRKQIVLPSTDHTVEKYYL